MKKNEKRALVLVFLVAIPAYLISHVTSFEIIQAPQSIGTPGIFTWIHDLWTAILRFFGLA